MSINGSKAKQMLSTELVGFCLFKFQCSPGELFLLAGPDEILELWELTVLPRELWFGVGGRGVANLDQLSRTSVQSRIDKIFQLITYRCSLRECLGSFTQFNLRHK